jgi:hypothetical protein
MLLDEHIEKEETLKHLKKNIMIIAGAVALSACVSEPATDVISETEVTPEGTVKTTAGKADAWNFRNDPARFRTELTYEFSKFPLEAQSPVPWAANYWPVYKDSINDRWQGVDVLSPAEKYDVAFNNWEATEDFMKLRPFNTNTCEFDAEYYDQLGPVANFTSKFKGNLKSRNGKDDDRDGISDAEECKSSVEGETNEEKLDGVETWWGICHAWAPAAIMEPEPLAPVTRDGVTFDVSDQKALLMMQWDKSSAYMMGGRCNDKEVERDDITGRVISSDCRDLNAGSWHVIISNLIGMNNRGMVIERTWNYEVWNQPLFGYKVKHNEEITLERAHELLNLSADTAGGSGELIHGLREGSNTAIGVINLVNGASLSKLDDTVGLDKRGAEAIIAFRSGNDGLIGTDDDDTYRNLTELEDTFFVGEAAFGKLSEYATANGFVPERYAYNDKAVKFIEIKMSTDWITEQHPLKERTDNVISRYTRHDNYHYILELDAADKIIGGEWVGSSIASHPDFVWLPVRGAGGNPHLDMDVIRDIVMEGRKSVLGEAAAGDIFDVASSEKVAIPDNSTDGAVSTIDVPESGKILSMTLDLNIEHTYRGDLSVVLRHGSISIPVYNGRESDSPSSDNVELTSEIVNGFEGSDIKGQWEVFVVDGAGADVGAITGWSLHFEVEK